MEAPVKKRKKAGSILDQTLIDNILNLNAYEVEKSLEEDIDPNLYDSHGRNALEIAMFTYFGHNNLERKRDPSSVLIVESLLKHGSNPNTYSKRADDKTLPLWMITEQVGGDIFMYYLLEHGLDPNKTEKSGENAMKTYIKRLYIVDSMVPNEPVPTLTYTIFQKALSKGWDIYKKHGERNTSAYHYLKLGSDRLVDNYKNDI